MVKFILEDMKLNKGRRVPINKEIDFSSAPTKESDTARKKVEDNKESILKEYLKKEEKKERILQRSPRIKSKSKILHKFTIFIFIFTILLGVIYWGGNIFQKADITITSKHQLITYENKQFVAGKEEGENNINFEIMITSDKKNINIVLTEPKEVSIKAQGSITLYNEFSTKAEKIIAGTFVSDNEGKTYKTNSTVSIPGYKTENKKIIPGQVVVKITSFLPGDMYNGEPTSFHITSFKGTTKYNKIYGKLKNPLTGGASGLVYTLDEISQKNIDNIVNSSFKKDLLEQAKTLVPPGYILYPNALAFSYDKVDNVMSKTPETDIEINGTISVALLKEKSLINNIIKTSLLNIGSEEFKEIKISDLDKLTFNFTNNNQSINKEINSIPFYLSGNVNAIWYPDVEILKTKLIGVHKDEVLSIFRQDPGIASALVKIFPPWQKYIPNDLLKININTQ